jgi:crossover junction endodeoxyribonuclease RusA
MPVFRFTVPGNPIPKARPRVVKGRTYTPARTVQAENAVKLAARRARIPRLDGPVKLTATFYRESAHACDVDNLVKTVSDALNTIAFKDDSQIVWLPAVKTIDRENPRTEVELEPLEAVEAGRSAA